MFKRNLWFMLLSVMVFALAACGNGEEETEEETGGEASGDTEIQVASQTIPMTDVVEIAGEAIEEPYSVEMVEVADNIQYNEALLNEEVDANFAQHEPFMEMFNEERDGNLVAIQPIYNAIVGYYSPVYDSMEEIEDGAEVAIPSDATNEARALMVLEQHDLITLADGVTYDATVDDIEENPRDFTFTHVDLLNLTSAYEDGVELVFNYPTYIDSIGLTPDDAVFLEEDEDNTFAITLVAREDNQDSEEIQALQEAFTSDEVYEFLSDLEEEGHLEPAFEPGE
ncbi:MetQ/NlpA family ABC transporter substrate-binding protein [Salinicoccus halitifaciens]|uniref:D-methionine transport system substrate-binding protein n=1 Tax=Salinicoccus halitifaciens TaxID=1073415 RepID=A0ABV2EAD1_9STAP|nr:MetQ/NlpA family ABC transporter substrate-binding protein [Salinicoccus halitifaciens]MCD2138514.1 MetQ/NlpA family ABC transporter substrate-binding protein [Salinicoccus halitifaciens]